VEVGDLSRGKSKLDKAVVGLFSNHDDGQHRRKRSPQAAIGQAPLRIPAIAAGVTGHQGALKNQRPIRRSTPRPGSPSLCKSDACSPHPFIVQIPRPRMESNVTAAESKNLRKRNRVCWRRDAADSGTIIGTSWNAVTIVWDTGQVATVHHGDMREIHSTSAKPKSV
jgi:hypothetical protein